MILVGGMTGIGKSSVAKLLGDHFNSKVYYENVEDNQILPLFYSESEEEILKNRYPFLLQMNFLNDSYESMRKACVNKTDIIDRSIYEDWYFARKNMERGRLSELEMSVYERFLNSMIDSLNQIQNRTPELMVYLKGSFETVSKRINQRGREYEQDKAAEEYHRFLWEEYDKWVESHYDESKLLIIDMDNIDIVNSEEDRKMVIAMVEERLEQL